MRNREIMAELRFTKEHEWIRVEGDIGTVGISAYAQEQLGDVVYVEVPGVGKKVAKGGEAAVVESVKAASEVYAPVSGEITEANDKLSAEPALVNASPMGEGWFFKMKIANKKELAELMDEAAYKKFVEGIG
jgi:glycine cleavage system H protein